MKWQILAKDSGKDIIKTLLYNRGLKTKKDIQEFLHPPLPSTLYPLRLGIDKKNLERALKRIRLAIKSEEPVVVYGDYDADGICATAIMWEALRDLGAKALPFIPRREEEGYGLSVAGIKNIDPSAKLIIAVDSGVVAHEAVEFAKKRGIDVIILDHHEKPRKLPKPYAIVHTEKLCAAGIAYFVGSILKKKSSSKELFFNDHLELAAIATITDLMPLIGVNRSIVKYGLEELNKTSRPGLEALFAVAGIEKVGTYEIGFMIGPRLNASGRIENALTALRLLCTKDKAKAQELAMILNKTNRDRQLLLEEQTLHALSSTDYRLQSTDRIIVVEHESYHQGVIGLIAGKLVEKYYLPAIVIARGETLSKASARSISGFNIIEAIRASEKILVNAGGHPMAAGFTIETINISKFRTQISKLAGEEITPEMLERSLRVDCELPLETISMELYNRLSAFAPFGLGNPEPVFASTAKLESFRTVGQDGKHLKIVIDGLDAIAFGQGHRAAELKVGETVSLAYTLDLNSFNGSQNLQLKVKDIKLD